jgi:hypothetical protein
VCIGGNRERDLVEKTFGGGNVESDLVEQVFRGDNGERDLVEQGVKRVTVRVT